jgi:hypothetical protein
MEGAFRAWPSNIYACHIGQCSMGGRGGKLCIRHLKWGTPTWNNQVCRATQLVKVAGRKRGAARQILSGEVMGEYLSSMGVSGEDLMVVDDAHLSLLEVLVGVDEYVTPPEDTVTEREGWIMWGMPCKAPRHHFHAHPPKKRGLKTSSPT